MEMARKQSFYNRREEKMYTHDITSHTKVITGKTWKWKIKEKLKTKCTSKYYWIINIKDD